LQAVDTTLILLIVILEFIAVVINTGVYGWGMTVAIDNAIISVIVSAVVSFGIFGLKKSGLNLDDGEVPKPPNLKRNCSTLTTLLQSFYHKRQRINIHKETHDMSKPGEHTLELPFDADKLDETFERSRYLLSEDLISEYMKYVEQDTYHNIFQARRGVGSQVALVNLKQMQSTSEKEFGLLNKKYKELMGFPA
jgi:hypothetical protein